MASDDSGPAILSVTYRVGSGGADLFSSWLSRVRADVVAARGFLGTGIDRGPAGDDENWVVSYKFGSDESLDRWLASEGFRAALAEMPAVLTGTPLEQRVAEGGGARSGEVVTATVPAGREEEYRRLRAELDATAARMPGFVSIDVFEPPPNSRTWSTLLVFDSERALQGWRDSPARIRLVDRIKDIAVDDARVVPTGFGQWFSVNAVATAEAPAWKQAMTVQAVLYLMVSVLNITLGNLIGGGVHVSGSEVLPGLGLPFPAVVWIGNAVGTVLLTWVLMPVVTRAMGWWLDPAATRDRTIAGAVLLIVVYIAEVALFIWTYQVFGI